MRNVWELINDLPIECRVHKATNNLEVHYDTNVEFVKQAIMSFRKQFVRV